MSKIQFSVEDIINKFEETMPLSAEERDREISGLNHELRGRYSGMFGFLELIKGALNDSKVKIYQEAYLDNMLNLSRLAIQDMDNIMSAYRHKTESELSQYSQNEVSVNSIHLMQSLKSIAKYTPIFDKLNNLEELSAENKEYATMLDTIIDQTIETYNQHFSRESLLHDFDKEFKEYAQKYGTGSKGLVKIEKLDDITYIGPTNYLRGVMLVLEKNIIDHSTNPQNDIAHRLTPDFEKKMKVWIEPNHDERFLTVYVKDNGFGISPSVQDKLFERGASTKTDKTSEHGIGLWYVKNFVEKHGGKIGFETELGQGTTFHFTIPYDCIYQRDKYADLALVSATKNNQ